LIISSVSDIMDIKILWKILDSDGRMSIRVNVFYDLSGRYDMGKVNIKPVGDRAVLLEFGDQINEEINRMVMQAAGRIGRAGITGLQEMVPAFASLLICYDPLVTDYRELAEQIDPLVSGITAGTVQTGRLVEIPVCYGGIYGEDLAFVARHAGLSEEEVIRIHSGRDYRIYMLGFLPGFPYLGGMDERIFTPRLCQSADENSGRLCGNRRRTDRNLSDGISGRLAADWQDTVKAV